MLRTVNLRLEMTWREAGALERTIQRFNEACEWLGGLAFDHKIRKRFDLHHLAYREVRGRFGLSAQMAVRAIAKVADARKAQPQTRPHFRPDGAIPYDPRILSWHGNDMVSLLSLEGRIHARCRMGEYQRRVLGEGKRRGECDLFSRKGRWFLSVVVETLDPPLYPPTSTLGVDLGVKNLATDSDGTVFTSGAVDRVRERMDRLKASLQRKGTKSAKRHLKKLGQRESRFRRHINHCVSKSLVERAEDTKRAIALEDLGGIRERTTVRRSQRRHHGSWAFRQLRTFVEYKAALKGVPVVLVDPRNTSRTCPSCGTVDKKNRPTRDEFRCVSCGLAGPADRIAATNIAARAAVERPIVGEGEAWMRTHADSTNKPPISIGGT